TIAEQQPANFYHFLIDNGCYATTGGQPVPNADHIAYDVIARGAGYPRAFAFSELEQFSASLPDILNHPGPVFVAAKVIPEIENAPIGRRRRWQTARATRLSGICGEDGESANNNNHPPKHTGRGAASLSHRRGPVPMAAMGSGLRRADEGGGGALISPAARCDANGSGW